MRHFVIMLTIGAAVAFAAPAFAKPAAQAACEEAGGTWDADTSTCKKKGY